MKRTPMLISLLTAATLASASAIDRGQYAQVPPEIRQWYQDQKIPGTTGSCCSVADGVNAEEDIRGQDYWVRWMMPDDSPISPGALTDWMKVPPELIIKGARPPYGAPVVWYYFDAVGGNVGIRCYVPGPGG